MFMQWRSNYIVLLAIFGLAGIPSCWGWEESQEEVQRTVSTLEEEEKAPRGKQGTEGHEELRDVMASAARHMKRLEVALGGSTTGYREVNWATTRDSAKILEDLIGRRCVNSYIKVHKDVPQDFVQTSQRFNDAVLRLLVAGRHQDVPLAQSQFQLMQEGCEKCHQKYRKEQSASDG